jgi:hypothetical protein
MKKKDVLKVKLLPTENELTMFIILLAIALKPCLHHII